MKPAARIVKSLNGHRLSAALHAGTWLFTSDFPEIAQRFDGTTDASDACALFEELATAGVNVDEPKKESA